MKFTILIPHYKTGKMTAYCISQLIKFKGKHEVDIMVIDNNAGDGSIEYLNPFLKEITIVDYPKNILQSHGIAFDYVIPQIKTDYFITLESDSFPTMENWLDYYEFLINNGYQGAGSVMQLSGGSYMHPCGAMYCVKNWKEAKEYCNQVQYAYLPNAAMKEGFACHLMIHLDVFVSFIKSPLSHIELSPEYKSFSIGDFLRKRDYYSPVVGPFHNGMGNLQESIKNYGQRNIGTDTQAVILDNREYFIYRIGYEPGQWFTYWQLAMGKMLFEVPTYTKWMENRENQQQEYSMMENGLKHLWGVSAFYKSENQDMKDVIDFKAQMVEDLYNSLPENEKTPPK